MAGDRLGPSICCVQNLFPRDVEDSPVAGADRGELKRIPYFSAYKHCHGHVPINTVRRIYLLNDPFINTQKGVDTFVPAIILRM